MNEPPETNRCDEAKIVPVGSTGASSVVSGSGYTVTKQHVSLVFGLHLFLPAGLKCNPQVFPAAFPDSGGSWFTASSVPVPESVFEKFAEVMVTVSADPTNKPKANCGLPAGDGSCSEDGAWQGELTFKRYHG